MEGLSARSDKVFEEKEGDVLYSLIAGAYPQCDAFAGFVGGVSRVDCRVDCRDNIHILA